MNKEKDKILHISDIAVHSNPFELNIDFIKNECKFMDKEDIYKWILEDELKLKDLQHQLEEKDKVIDEISKRCDRILEKLERGKNEK